MLWAAPRPRSTLRNGQRRIAPGRMFCPATKCRTADGTTTGTINNDTIAADNWLALDISAVDCGTGHPVGHGVVHAEAVQHHPRVWAGGGGIGG
ncbi:MAG: hypothetical protein MZV70_03545 [Desulfobacterales bacterium]|nr:hypothetical protein [Desulfobacterales bacterium]